MKKHLGKVRPFAQLTVVVAAYLASLFFSSVANAQEVELVDTESPAKAQNSSAVHPIDRAIRLLKSCEERYQKLVDYRANLVREEMVDGKLAPTMYLECKVRRTPFSIYCRWLQPDKGREALFVEGENDNMILSHHTGLSRVLALGTQRIAPDHPNARRGARMSIRELGIGALISRLNDHWEFERKQSDVKVRFDAAKLNDRPCIVVSITHQPGTNEKFTYQFQRVFIDRIEQLPVRVEHYAYANQYATRDSSTRTISDSMLKVIDLSADKQKSVEDLHGSGTLSAQAGLETPEGPLVECHTYVNLRIDTSLNDLDFSTKHPEYGFNRLR